MKGKKRGLYAGRGMHIEYHTTKPKKEKAAECIYLTSSRECQNKLSPCFLSKCFIASYCKFKVKKSDAVKTRAPEFSSETTLPSENMKTGGGTKKQPFEGIQFIKMADIIMPRHALHPPMQSKVEQLLRYYKENGTLDKPIIVSCAGEKYRLEDKYLRYYVAKQLGLKEIPAKIGVKTEIQLEDAIRKKGTRLKHPEFGIVIVDSSSLKHVYVKDARGKIIALDIETCLNQRLLTLET